MDVGHRVNELRLKRKMTAKELAGRVGVTPAFISALEHKSTNVSLRTLSKICDIFGITLAEFFTFEPSKISPRLLNLLESLSEDQLLSIERMIDSLTTSQTAKISKE